MAINKIDRIDMEIAKTRENITEYQNKLSGLEAQKTEAENLQIVQLVRLSLIHISTGSWKKAKRNCGKPSMMKRHCSTS